MWQRAIHDKKIVGLLTILLLVGVIPLTVSLTQKEQDLRQRAAESSLPVCSESGTDTILIIDKSNSMNIQSSPTDLISRFERAKLAAKNFADILDEKNKNLPQDKKHKLSIVSFSNSDLTAIDSQLTTNMQEVKESIDNIQPGDNSNGWTCIECGVTKANLEMTSQRQRTGIKNVAILLTDGKANWLDGGKSSVTQSVAENEAFNEVIRGFNNAETSYYTIGLGSQQEISDAFLKKIATQTHAAYYYAPTATNLQGIYTSISQVLGRGSISGTVFNDSNGNNILDTNEQKLSGWNVRLTQGSQNISTATTDTSGLYTFSNVCNASYQVRLTVQPGWDQSTPPDNNPLNVTITNTEAIVGKNFGVRQESIRTTLSCSPSGGIDGLTRFDIETTLKDSNNNPISNQDIQVDITKGNELIRVTKQNQNAKTDTQGRLFFIYTLTEKPAGEFNGLITFSYKGDDYNSASSCSVPITFKPADTSLTFDVILHGIGSGGDNANPTNATLSNKNPKTRSRSIAIDIYDDNNLRVANSVAQADYNATVGGFSVTRSLGPGYPTGKYSILISSPGYLTRKIPRIVTITKGEQLSLGKIELISGDVDSNNALNILDYDIMVGCYSDYAAPISCTAPAKQLSDLTDEGKVDQFDYNLFLRELSVQEGDTIK